MRSYRPLVLLTVFTVLTAIVSMGVGHYPVSPLAVIDVLWSAITGRPTSQPSVVANVVLVVRLPRVLAAMLVGAGLAAAGAAYQTLFRNPLASPAILGVSAGAGFGAALAMLLHAGALAVQGSAFLGGLFAVGAAMFIAGRLGKGTSLVLVLAGLVVSALFQALTSALKYVADPLDTLPTIVFWLLRTRSCRRSPSGCSAAWDASPCVISSGRRLSRWPDWRHCTCCAGRRRCWRLATTRPARWAFRYASCAWR